MQRLVRDTIDLIPCDSLDQLLDRLTSVRETLPDPAGAEVRLRGDDIFGRLITIRYSRPLTKEEAECEARYATPE
jgi:hypothetical protein